MRTSRFQYQPNYSKPNVLDEEDIADSDYTDPQYAKIVQLYDAIETQKIESLSCLLLTMDDALLKEYMQTADKASPLATAVSIVLLNNRTIKKSFAVITTVLKNGRLIIDQPALYLIDNTTPIKCTAFFAAAAHEKLNLMQLLLDYDANINALNQDGETIAHYAARTRKKALLAWLVQNGIDMTIKNNNGKTADDLALEAEQSSYCNDSCIIL